ncbi:hypothetical protein LEP1GSC036_0587 [Leptospira weilii str. 2006001853]|uniref:Uncharacterized protein n=2 Tax=Leptospira weilii TaxID=28184 RepID=A0A828Z3E4_9LEPT|nr:hypothetical protein LEP1GSC036_0587 [Leptospira weilii str. 2006001853]EMJ62844.1 hypothetical protein LEP1GSC051_3371 [Leptospira sp. P2653]EMM73035.1 hypothetical protein LEP1GSC038_2477 [Leptospira weilii str. 2006001855]EMN42976.1 hypothetical protein LEP1GSC086_1784 [Leptospira weilii str. LNT 1234]
MYILPFGFLEILFLKNVYEFGIFRVSHLNQKDPIFLWN